MRLMMVAICLYMLWGYSANAQSTIALPLSTVDAREKTLSVDLDLSINSNLRDSTDSQYEASTNLELLPAYKLSKASLSMRVILEQKHYADEKTSISNTTVSLARDPISIGEARTLNLSIFGIIPTNEQDRIENSLRGGAGGGIGVNQKYSFLKNSGSAGYTLSYLENFHEFERTNTNAANLQNRVRHTLALTQELGKKISLDILGRYQVGSTYQNALRTSFLISEQINFKVKESTELYLSHASDGDALKANGLDSNISLYGGGHSSFATGISVHY